MKQQLVILRGNTGSGKSTSAKLLKDRLGLRTMLLQQDVIRREILKEADKAGNPSVGLIKEMALYGRSNGYTVIIEGVLSDYKYGDMLRELAQNFDEVYPYYFDVSFEETMRRHALRPKAQEFGEAEMREWWKEKDYLKMENEQIIPENMNAEEIVALIVRDIDAPSHG